MSNKEIFRDHPIHAALEGIKEALGNINTESSNDDAILANIGKVIAHIEFQIKCCDPELITHQKITNALKSAKQKIESSGNVLSSYGPFHANFLMNLQDAIGYLNEIPFITPVTTKKSIVQMLKPYDELIERARSTLDTEALKGEHEEIKQLLDSIAEKSKDAKNKHLELDNLYDEWVTDTEENKSLTTKVSDTYSEINEKAEDIFKTHEKVESTNEKLDTLDSFYQKWFEDSTGEESDDNDSNRPLSQELEANRERLSLLIKEIDSILPSGLAAGLAKEYDDVVKKERGLERWWTWVAILMIIVSGLVVFMKTINIEDISEMWLLIFKGALLAIPYGLLIGYASKLASNAKKTADEYEHKKVAASTFILLKEQSNTMINETPQQQEMRCKRPFSKISREQSMITPQLG
ncbi:hypothetical protein [Ostreibacterium oceani]|uniref:Uncharacterized protein n=1 Tax=Ostreibacterium oceani TaxID=2654998 RepID=A0A6N7EV23_9GAMM|nr:hypothetical protein [Ostreibacterium oceani]MPV86411.1 hypothetical protein [Ostreibacterium oceani]